MESDGNLVPPMPENTAENAAENTVARMQEGFSFNFPEQLIDMIAERVTQSLKRDNPPQIAEQREDDHIKPPYDKSSPNSKARRSVTPRRSATPRRSQSRSHRGESHRRSVTPRRSRSRSYRGRSHRRSVTPRRSRSRSHRSESHRRSVTPRRSQARSQSTSNRARSHYDDSKHSRLRHDSKHRDSESDNYSREDSTPEPPRKRKKVSNTHVEECFPFNGETYINFNPNKHTVIDSTKVSWGNDILHVKWFPGGEKKAFCQIKTPPAVKTPYMDQNLAHNNLLSVLGLESWVGDNPGLKRKGFSTEFDHNNGLGQVIQLLKTNEYALIQANLSGKEAEFSKAFPDADFSAPSMAIFTKGWFGSDKPYLEWAKGDNLSLDEAAQSLDIYSTTKISKVILEEERDARALLVNNFSALRSLEIFGGKLKDEANIATAQAIAKLFLPNIKPSYLNWLSAKMKIRKLILHGQDHAAARTLLLSNLWDPAIFSKESVEQIRKRGSQHDMRNILNLSSTGELIKTSNNDYFQKSTQVSVQRRFPTRQDNSHFQNRSNFKGSYKKQFQTHPKKETKRFHRPDDKRNFHQNKPYEQSQSKHYDSSQNKSQVREQPQQKGGFQRKNKKFTGR